MLSMREYEEEEKQRRREDEESEALAQYLAEEEKRNQRIAEAKAKAESEKNKPSCKICLDEVEYVDVFPLDLCGHIFHPACVNQYLETRITDKQIPIPCPLPECGREMSVLDVQSFADRELFEKFERFAFDLVVERNPNLFTCCPTADCPFVFEDEEARRDAPFTCPSC